MLVSQRCDVLFLKLWSIYVLGEALFPVLMISELQCKLSFFAFSCFTLFLGIKTLINLSKLPCLLASACIRQADWLQKRTATASSPYFLPVWGVGNYRFSRAYNILQVICHSFLKVLVLLLPSALVNLDCQLDRIEKETTRRLEKHN